MAKHIPSLEEKIDSFESIVCRNKITNVVYHFSNYADNVDVNLQYLYNQTLSYLNVRKISFFDMKKMNEKEFKNLAHDIFYKLCEEYEV